jgi:predicted AAA+ superfamily ATPase
MEMRELAQRNPWWKNKELILEDRNLKKRYSSKVDWTPRLKYKFKLWEDVIYTLRGPRQVGKTTLVKIMIKELLLEQGVSANRIFFYSCDLVSSPKELANILECYLQNTRELTDERLFLFIDEISSIRDWQKGIKHLKDAGLLENCTVILTGSHSLDIRNASERLPGRRGNVADVLDKILVPMKFVEYVENRNPKLYTAIRNMDLLQKDNRVEIINELAKAIIPPELTKLSYYSKELSRQFQDYLLTGGIAPAMDAYAAQGSIPSSVYDTYVSAMLGDAVRWQKKETKMAQVVQRLIERLSSQISWQSLCQQTDFGSHHTIEDYVGVLESSFTVSTIYQLDRNKDAAYFEKDKKVYFQDPFIFHALRAWAFSLGSPFENSTEFVSNSEDCSKLVESVVCNHLIRLAFNMNPSSDYEYMNKVFHWKGSLRKEVDFVMKLNGNYLPIEVKYKNEINRSDLQGLHSFIKGGKCYRGIVITKDTLRTQENLTLIPHYLFLMLV